jgi:uncharacterized RDD family membrane protein YckC
MTTKAAERATVPASVKPRPAPAMLARLRAPFSLRCGAILIDYILLAAILAFSTLISRLLGGGARTAGTSSETIAIFLVLVVAVLNLGIVAGLTGLTVGKWATGLRICRSDGTDIDMGRAFLRHFVGYPVSFFFLGVGFLVAALTPSRRGLHDWIADTIVVRNVSVRRMG